MDSNPVCHPSPAKNIKCSFLDYIQLLMIGWAGRWTRTPSATPLQPKNKMFVFGLCFNFWWSAGLVDRLKPHCHPSPAKTIKCSFSYYVQLLMIDQWTRTPSATPLQSKKWNACFWIMFNFWWSAGLIDRLKSHLPPLSSRKNEMLIFRLRSTSDDRSMDSNPVRHPSPAKEMKCLFLDYVQLLMIGRAGWWTRTPSATPLESKKLNAHFWITFNFLWLAGLVDGH